MAEDNTEGTFDREAKRTVKVETLRQLGFSEALISEALRREQNGVNDVDPPADLQQRIMSRIMPEPGDRMEDGTLYAGISPDTGKAMHTTPADVRSQTFFGREKLTFTFNQAKKYAAKFDAHGHQDWRVPTKGELNVLFNNRAAIGGFNESGSDPAGWYWSSTEDGIDALVERFSDGGQGLNYLINDASLRCVRG